MCFVCGCGGGEGTCRTIDVAKVVASSFEKSMLVLGLYIFHVNL